MKREIKFRAWNIEMKQMVFPSIEFGRNIWPCTYKEITETKEDKGKKVVIVTELVSVDHILQEEHCYDVMQFTGLQDINGKDIYEGDILKVEWQKDSKNGYLQMSDSYIEYKEVVFVSYLKLSFVLILNNGKYFNLPKSCTINIIGNIYETPELLKTTENE